ncbi:MAG: DUF4198 domain-containing protein [Zoogloeaceae bacterium]|nr:DUF4198 domain-containing protein [Zoogloeaceae bacterium]
MKLRTRIALAALASALAAPLAGAHERWLLPSSTVLSKAGYITLDAASSNEVFYFNHRPLQINDSLVITTPDGHRVAPENIQTGKLRSVFDLNLTEPGTYSVAMVSAGVMASWKEGTETRRWRGARAELASKVPADAPELTVREVASRVETFVTVGNPTPPKAGGEGLELMPVTHPNDLYAGEAASFAFHYDGKPVAGVEVQILPGAMRYRNAPEELKLVTDARGRITVTWPHAGMYYLSASIEGTADDKIERRASYIATLEVLPQ